MAAFPTADDLRDWLRSEEITESSPDMVELSFDAANELLLDRIDPAVLILKAAAAGIVTDADDDAFDQAVLDAWCPSYLRLAILIRAAAFYVRRDSANGTISFGEFAARVQAQDPDVEELIRPLYVQGVA